MQGEEHLSDSGGDSERDKLIAKFHRKLSDKWKNSSGVGMTFVPKTVGLLGEPYPLTTGMISEWIDYIVSLFIELTIRVNGELIILICYSD